MGYRKTEKFLCGKVVNQALARILGVAINFLGELKQGREGPGKDHAFAQKVLWRDKTQRSQREERRDGTAFLASLKK